MKTRTKNTGIKVTTSVKAGGLNGFNGPNHNRSGLKIKTAIKAGTVIQAANHSRRPFALNAPTNTAIKVTTGVKAGGLNGFNGPNHSRTALKIKTTIKAGTVIQAANHSRRPLALNAPTNTGIKVNTGVKAGGLGGFCGPNHNRSNLKIKSAIKAGTVIQAANHNLVLRALA